jgi:hypothetical protein
MVKTVTRILDSVPANLLSSGSDVIGANWGTLGTRRRDVKNATARTVVIVTSKPEVVIAE